MFCSVWLPIWWWISSIFPKSVNSPVETFAIEVKKNDFFTLRRFTKSNNIFYFCYEWIRLDTSFNTVLLEKCLENRMTPNCAAPPRSVDIASNRDNISSSSKRLFDFNNCKQLNYITFLCLNVFFCCNFIYFYASDHANGNVLQLKSENNGERSIEIADSDDESMVHEHQMQTVNDSIKSELRSNASLMSNNAGAKSDNEHTNKIDFDLNEENCGSSIENDSHILELLHDQSPSCSSANIVHQAHHQKQPKCDTVKVKLFKCKHCDYSSKYNGNILRHQRIHAQ